MNKLFISVLVFFPLLLPCCYSSSNVGRAQRVDPEESTSQIEKIINGITVILRIGDITELTFDPLESAAIVNAANENLLHGGGVCGAIYAAAGVRLDEFTLALGNFQGAAVKCPTGEAVITPAFDLSAAPSNIKHIIHAVGPNVQGDHPSQGQIQLLASAYTKSLEVAAANGVCSIAFPCISTAIYGFPPGEAAPIAFNTIINYANANPGTSIRKIIICCFLRTDYFLYKPLISRLP